MISRLLFALLFIVAGIMHFLIPGTYLKIMPPILPHPLLLVYLSGAAELLGGIGILISRTRALAAWGLVALLIAVWPANIYMAMVPARFPTVPLWALYTRIPLQLPLIAWAWLYTRRPIETLDK